MKVYKKILVHSILSFVFISCGSSVNLINKKFSYKSQNRTLELSFKDSANCSITNTFNCSDIEEQYKITKIECEYKRIGNNILIINKKASNNKGLYIPIPNQVSKECFFLNQISKERNIKTSPSYSTDFEKYGIIPNITNDTLKIVNKKIIYYKKNDYQSIGFVFK